MTSLLFAAVLATLPVPFIDSADVSGGNVFIMGTGLGTGKTPLVTLGNTPLTVSGYAPTSIVATLPASTQPGSYALVVTTYGASCVPLLPSVLVLTVGAVGPTGPAGPAGPSGAPGQAGPQGATGMQGPSGPQGATGAAGPQGAAGTIGPQGPAGATGQQGATGPQGSIGPAGPAGSIGQSVVGASEGPGTNCAYGGSSFTTAAGTTFACNGAPGAAGQQGLPGVNGQSVVGASEPPGTNCTYGGTSFTSASGITYACNGSPGSGGGAPASGAVCRDANGVLVGPLVQGPAPYCSWFDSSGVLWNITSDGVVHPAAGNIAVVGPFFTSLDCTGPGYWEIGEPGPSGLSLSLFGGVTPGTFLGTYVHLPNSGVVNVVVAQSESTKLNPCIGLASTPIRGIAQSAFAPIVAPSNPFALPLHVQAQ